MSTQSRTQSRTLSRALLAAAVLALAALSSCVVAAVGVTAVVVSQEFLDNAQVAFMEEDYEVVWEQTKRTLQRMASDPVEIDEELQAATVDIEGSHVTAHVEIYDVGETKLSVSAKKWSFYDAARANQVITQIKRDLDR